MAHITQSKGDYTKTKILFLIFKRLNSFVYTRHTHTVQYNPIRFKKKIAKLDFNSYKNKPTFLSFQPLLALNHLPFHSSF